MWVTFEVWLHKIAWGERVDSLQEPQCSMARLRVWEQEESSPEMDKQNGEGLNVAELWSQMSPETCWEVDRSGIGVG